MAEGRLRPSGIVTLLTDFGWEGPFPAAMKGVVLSINPRATVVDITHSVPRHDVKTASLILWSTYKYFPSGTVHVAVVDPGVGTARKALAVRSRRFFFVGPDNGVLMMAAEEDAPFEAREIVNPSFKLSKVSGTFHGRDIFAPTAAKLSMGEGFEEAGPVVKSPVSLPKPIYKVEGEWLTGEVVYVDPFGNLTLSIPGHALADRVDLHSECTVEVAGRAFNVKFVEAYGAVKVGEPLLVENSFGLVELAVNQGSAEQFFKVRAGSVVKIRAPQRVEVTTE
ncbi:MAG: S-adenosyl-l-methionine hydroxide adenosyltransferase family protein [Candidatus Nezhaarchaeota archaeon]|nr:S-adenosyl-l-methionine hydroxide adenosyltransferase family protein [Candidatus Nezhaarchaeota archaeon]